MKGAAIFILFVLAMAHVSQGAVTCGQLTAALGQCVSYLTGGAKTPAPACCTGIQTLRGQLPTRADRRQACECVKKAVRGIKNVKNEAVSSLPGACNSPLPFAVNLNMNCQAIP